MRLILEDVVKSFDKKIVLNGASASFETGKIYGLLGRNGAGKTTLFNCISKDCRIDGGSICLDKGEGPEAQYDSIDIGFVYSTPHLPDFMTGYEFIKFFIEINRARIQRIHPPDYYLDMVGIKSEDQHRLLKDYSHGMQNKVQMLSSIMTQPPVLLLDEPLTSFDVVAAHEMKELIIRLKSNSIIIFSTHILQLAQDLCDEIVLLHNRQLQPISANDIHQPDFEEEIVALLSEEGGEGK